MKHNNKQKAVSRVAALLLLLPLLGTMTACAGKDPAASADSPGQTTEAKEDLILQTKYGSLPYAGQFVDSLRHLEVVQDKVAMEVFYMVTGNQEMELARIYFGDDTSGTPVGYLTVGPEELSVSYSICSYQEGDFPDAQTKALYGGMMDAFSELMNVIYADNRFSTTRTLPVSQVEMTYWTVDLPPEIQWTETEENGIYRADFFGTLRGEQTPLYSITLGDDNAPTVLGALMVEGESRTVGVESHFTQPEADWTEAERNEAYTMMETIELVIQAITGSENFSG